jgi:hypothetical protein
MFWILGAAAIVGFFGYCCAVVASRAGQRERVQELQRVGAEDGAGWRVGK